LGNVQDVACHILANHVPGFAGAADAEALALADGVVDDPVVPTLVLAVGRMDFARLTWQIALEEGFEIALTDEADTGGVLTVVIRQAGRVRDTSDLGFLDATDR